MTQNGYGNCLASTEASMLHRHPVCHDAGQRLGRPDNVQVFQQSVAKPCGH
ncbi:unnamed protein product [Ciceribacter selenitireducens ATCC BAA-1503]|uniref:Uncharacterized protein n=1 Tax=Ciceribacter selenitireducens ATCC BAA-1503 TaxID=1336235 RepID=A0A376AFP9_9HYPH|nr:unnamed protein product [Ciceribacter selenitireducens ATCC BAA-1503]